MENSYHGENRPTVVPVEKVKQETPDIRSIYAKVPEIADSVSPGQFIMVWVIGVDEIPMAVSGVEENGIIRFTVEKVGDATSKLHELEEGDLIGFRGPHGNGFDISGKKLLIVGGGCGMAPLNLTVKRAVEKGKDVTVVISAATEENLLFKSKMESLDVDLFLGTEDGSAGVEGLATDVLEKALEGNDYDSCLVCGPEKMMFFVAEMVKDKDINLQLSLNRYMKCGVGICGSCSLDPQGLRVCEEGPVFDYEEIEDSEFGDYKRDPAGRKTEI